MRNLAFWQYKSMKLFTIGINFVSLFMISEIIATTEQK